MTSPIPKARFGYGHPFWKTAVEMRQAQHTLQEILDSAHQAGHVDLEYHHISHALRHAPADLHLPTVTSRFLRRRYEKVTHDFNSFEMMKDLAQEAMNKISEAEEELSDPQLGQSRRMYLEGQLWRWYGRAFDWANSCSDLAVRMRDMDPSARPVVEDRLDADVHSELQSLAEDFRQMLPPGPAVRDEDISRLYGSENIRRPGEYVDGDYHAIDEEE